MFALLAAWLPVWGADESNFVEYLRPRPSGFEAAWRYLLVGAVAARCGAGAVFIHRWLQTVGRKKPAARRRLTPVRRTPELSAHEQAFVAELAQRCGAGGPADLLAGQVHFEKAVQHVAGWIAMDPAREQLLNDVRRRMRWESMPHGVPLVNSQLLDLNIEVEIFGTGAQAGYCARAVLAHRDSGHLVFRLQEKVDAPWKVRDVIQVYFWRPNDAGYLFKTRIIDVRDTGTGYLVVEHPPALERHQRRMAVRVPYLVPVRFICIPQGRVGDSLGIAEAQHRGGLHDGETEDLSAGGIRLRCEQSLHVGDYLSIFEFPPLDGSEVLGKVVVQYGSGHEVQRSYGVQFVGFSNALRDVVTRKVFELQREGLAHSTELALEAELPATDELEIAPGPMHDDQ